MDSLDDTPLSGSPGLAGDSRPSSARGASAGTLLNILVVDDDPVVTELSKVLLEYEGHQVNIQNSSAQALSDLEKFKPDVLLLDIMMPGMDGFELITQIRKIPRFDNLKIITVSAKSYEFDRKRAEKLGANGYIQKPILTENFCSQVMALVQDKVDVTFWGVRGTLPVPGERSLRYGGNTSCVSMELADGQLLIFDAGTGIKELSNSLGAANKSRLEAKIFISHPHWDHINALPYFTPMFQQGGEFEILGPAHGDASMRQLISAQMDDVYFPITLKDFAARVYFRDLHEETISFGGFEVDTMLLNHPGSCLGYSVRHAGQKICYVTDQELFLETNPAYNQGYVDQLTAFVRDADILITDTTYSDEEYASKVGWGHSSVSEVVKLAHRASVKKLCLFHHDPDQDDDAIDVKLRDAKNLLANLGSSTTCVSPAEGSKLRV